MAKHIGKQSILFEKNISIRETSSIVGKKEGEGPLSEFFDIIVEDSMDKKVGKKLKASL